MSSDSPTFLRSVDTVDDFQWLEKGKRELLQKSRRTTLPYEFRLSSFKRMSRDAASTLSSSSKFAPKDGRFKERVTIHYETGRAPTLLMQLSPFDPSPPSIIEESVKSPSFDWSSYIRSSVNLSSPTSTRFSASLCDDSSIKPRHVESTKRSRNLINVPSPLSLNLPPPAKLQDTYPSSSTEHEANPPFSAISPRPFLPPTNDEPQTVKLAGGADLSMTTSVPETRQQASVRNSFLSLSRSNAEITEPSRPPINPLSDVMSSESSYFDAGQSMQQQAHLDSEEYVDKSRQERFPQLSLKSDPREPIRGFVGKQGDLGMISREDSSRERARKGNGMSPKSELVRIKSIGRAPRKYTPQPTPSDSTRTSIAVEQIFSSQMNVIVDEAAAGQAY
jgi:hypothetical protein